MASQKPKICVVIPTWNHKQDVLNAIESVFSSESSGIELTVCVVDNGSTDGTVKSIETKYPKVKLIKNSENLGFVEACNMGMLWGLGQRAEFIALLNDDTVVDGNLIKNIYGEHLQHKEAGAISAKVYFAKGFEYHKKYKAEDLGKVIWYAGGEMDWNNIYGSNRGVDEVDRGQYDETIETEFATGCFVMFKREALEKVGLYDRRFFAYLEDVDHSQRLKNAGYKVLYSPKGYLWHKVSQASGIGSQLNDYFLTRNRMIFGLKYASLRTRLALVRESFRLLFSGRKWQRVGIRDYYLGRFGKGSWK